ncbi:AAA family ATPase [Brassicibacter mesophilus]|uniref:AAA family ATPase n=1 Tax=Brassicibacter mesophilus TaxID=745119 RepID=UPI003D1D07D2
MGNELLALYQLGKISINEAMEHLIDDKKKQSYNNFLKEEREETLQEIIDELDMLIGLNNVKDLVCEIKAFIEIQAKRRKENLLAEPVVLHMIFKGNPGTGKTTVARLIGKIFKKMGMLEKGHLVEIERADIVGEYIGHTAVKVKQQVKKALGGILFIDEAYSLARGGNKDFGKEAIDALVKAMEDYKDNLILILAGYYDEMEEFLRSNPGLKSRFPIHIEFKDYTTDELLKIGELIASQKEYRLSERAIIKLKNILILKNDSYNSGNARLVRNIIEKSFRKQALRLQNKKNLTREDLILIKAEDIAGDDLY